ncbi:hypothetical protein J3F84DRAFT_390984 [Trichoderma pleuroticola]
MVFGRSKDKVIRTGMPFIAPRISRLNLDGGLTMDSANDDEVDLSDVFVRQRLDLIPSTVNTQFMLELQQFDLEGAVPREPSPLPEIETSKDAVITREEALQKVGNLIDTICVGRPDADNDNVTRLTSALTAEIVKVLPYDKKLRLGMWAEFAGLDELHTWVQQAVEDLNEHRWTQVEKIPVPPQWKYEGSMTSVIKDLRKLSDLENLPVEVRRQISTISHKFNYYVNEMVPKMLQRAKDEGRQPTEEIIQCMKKMETSLLSSMKEEMGEYSVARGKKRVRFADDIDGGKGGAEGEDGQNA